MATRHVAGAWQDRPPQSRSIAGTKHGFIQFRRRMEGTTSESLPETHALRIKHQRGIRGMKFSVEAKVAATIAIAFAALSIGAIAQEQSEHGTAELNKASLQGSEISLSVQNASSDNHLVARY